MVAWQHRIPTGPVKTATQGTEKTINMTNEVGVTMTQEPMQTLPLLFSFREKVVGKGFLAEVSMSGRALLEIEEIDGESEVWISGVQPVGFSGGGRNREEAFEDFHQMWTTILYDLMAEADDFQAFEASAKEFLAAQSPNISKLWDDAVVEVRKRNHSDPGLKTQAASTPVTFEVEELPLTPAANQIDGAALQPKVAA